MKNRFFLIISSCLILFSINAQAQLSKGGKPKSFEISAKGSIPKYTTGNVDHIKLLAEDKEEEKLGVAQRFGYGFDVNYNLDNSGSWQTLQDGSKIWKLKLESPGAFSINLLYDDFKLSEKVKFFIYSEDKADLIGAFTSDNNKDHGKFATGLVKGDVVILELNVPPYVSDPGKLSISKVIHAYRDMFDKADFNGSGFCNNNVICPEGDPWREEINSVAMIILGNGIRWCSGALVNNTRQDLTPYFLTANHCLNDPETFLIMFNYQSPNCLGGDGPTDLTLQGTTLIATNTYSDFALLLLDETPPSSYDVYYSGWTISETPAVTTVGIHHPAGDVKKISFNEDPVTSTDYYTSSGDSHWRVNNWEDGTTEGGSSGSPLFNQDHKIIGQLHGGSASCTSISSDWYGMFSKSWDYGSMVSNSLKYWLDPDNTGLTEMNGIFANLFSFSADANISDFPFSVNFTADAGVSVDSWLWDFGDGQTSDLQSPNHVYESPGFFSVNLQIESEGNTYYRIKDNYILVTADTMKADNISGGADSTVVITISAYNNIPINKIVIPFIYSGDVPLRLDSTNTIGCRTDYFNNPYYMHKNLTYFKATIGISKTNPADPDLEPGYGDILNIYFTILPEAELYQTTTINLEGYDNGPSATYLPTFFQDDVSYTTIFEDGSVETIYTGCCEGERGNIDGLGQVDIDDLIYFVNFVFDNSSTLELGCEDEADVNASGMVDIDDLIYMVDYVFKSPQGPAPLDCP